jgi:hypothetical protein
MNEVFQQESRFLTSKFLFTSGNILIPPPSSVHSCSRTKGKVMSGEEKSGFSPELSEADLEAVVGGGGGIVLAAAPTAQFISIPATNTATISVSSGSSSTTDKDDWYAPV